MKGGELFEEDSIVFDCNHLFINSLFKDERFELNSVSVDIVRDKGKTGTIVISDEKNETEIIPTSLFYEFEIKNKGSKIDLSDAFQIKIEPSAELSREVQNIIGENIFTSNSLGGGLILPHMPIKANEVTTTNAYFHLGTYRDSSNTPVFPSRDELMPIINSALKAELVLFLDGKEVARYNLSDQK